MSAPDLPWGRHHANCAFAPIIHIPTRLQAAGPSRNAAVPCSPPQHRRERARALPKEFKPRGCPSTVKCRAKSVPGTEVWAARSRPPGPDTTYWAEPTLLSLFASTLAGFASSTSCCSSVIGAGWGGHPQTSPRGSQRPGRRPREPCLAPRLPCALPRALRRSAHPGRPGAAAPPTWTRPGGRDWSAPAGGAGREGAGRGQVTASCPNPRGRASERLQTC